MKNIVYLITSILIFMSSEESFPAETYTSGIIQEQTPIIINGELSDWYGLTLDPIKIEKINKWAKPGRPRDEKDLSATFWCVENKGNIYVAIKVFDDRHIFGESLSERPYWDDAVEILLFSDTTDLPPVKIWITADIQGNTVLKGRDPQKPKSYPFLRNIGEIAAELSQTENGYEAEIFISCKILELVNWNQGQPLRMNIRIYDDDDGEHCEGVIEWTSDLYNEIVFSNVVDSPNSQNKEEIDEIDATYEIELKVKNPDQIDEMKNFENMINSALALEENKLYEEAIEILEDIVRTCDEKRIQQRAQLALGRNYFFINDFDKSMKLCEELLNTDTDSKIALEAQMVLISIEQKTSP